MGHAIATKRVYDPPAPEDGFRVLVDRLWPRGLKKEAAALDLWLKEVAPSAELRRWFGHEPSRWTEFQKRYGRELDRNPEPVQRLLTEIARGPVTLLFGTKETEKNNAVRLKAYLEEKL